MTTTIKFVPDGVPLVDDVRRARFLISEEFGHDPMRLIEHLRKCQELHPERIVSYGDSSTAISKKAIDSTADNCVSDVDCSMPKKDAIASATP